MSEEPAKVIIYDTTGVACNAFMVDEIPTITLTCTYDIFESFLFLFSKQNILTKMAIYFGC